MELKLMFPARPPFPTAISLLFHATGIQSSKLTSGATRATTRQNAGTPTMRMTLFVITALTLMLSLILARWLVGSKFGRVLMAIRDAETRVMFSGYNPLGYKLFVWTFSAVLCGIAGALYVPQVGIINPGEMSPANSIEMAVWVAVGGRGTLIGPIIGAFFVNGAKSWLTQMAPEFWLYFLGALFILVTLYLPDGIVGGVKKLLNKNTEVKV